MIGTILTIWLMLKLFGVVKEFTSFLWNGVSFSVSALVAGVAAFFFTRWVIKKMTGRGNTAEDTESAAGEQAAKTEPATASDKQEEEPYYPETKFFRR